MNTKTIRQTVKFPGPPQAVYDLLMDSSKHKSLSGEPARISKRIGGQFSAWAGHITGFNLVLNPGKKIVQAWRATGWLPEHYSIAIFDIEEAAGGSKLTFYADWSAVQPLQWTLSRLDRGLLDAHERSDRKW
jgi:activator of HSP90 ATPase